MNLSARLRVRLRTSARMAFILGLTLWLIITFGLLWLNFTLPASSRGPVLEAILALYPPLYAVAGLVVALPCAAVAWIVLLVVPIVWWRIRRNRPRQCPYCFETINAQARVCRYCGRDVQPIA